MRKLLILIFLTFHFLQHFGQQNVIDSLETVLVSTTKDTSKVFILSELAWNYRNIEPQKGLEYAKKAFNISVEKEFNKGIYDAQTSLGVIFRRLGNYDSSIFYLSKNLTNNNTQYSKARSNNNLGLVYMDMGEFEKSLQHFLEAKTLYSALENKKGVAGCLVNIGIINYYQGNIDKALTAYKKSLKIYQELKERNIEAIILNNIGAVHKDRKEYDKALNYYNKSINKYILEDNKYGIATELSNMAVVYSAQKNYEKLLEMEHRAYKIRKQLADKKGMCVSATHISIGFLKEKSIDSALYYANLSLNLAEEIGAKSEISSSYKQLADIYYDIGSYKLAIDNYLKHTAIKDSVLNENNSKLISELEAKYENEKKKKEIELLKNEAAIDKIKIERNKIVQWTFIAGSILLFVVIVLIYWKFKESKNVNKIIESQKAIVESQNIDILSSIRYAKRIQNSILPSLNEVKNHYQNCFVYYRPKDIVSGDFYWVDTIGDYFVFAVVDCTGHGVPGAFMSMVGHNALSEIKKSKSITKPSEILNLMNVLVTEALSKTSENENITDGMDIALCSLNKKTNALQYAGVNIALYYIQNNEIIQIKGDKVPIGPSHRESIPYKNHQIQLESGDQIFLSSDGFPDQFGGENDKKFNYIKLKEMFLELSTLDIEMQEKQIDAAFTTWKGQEDQVDDVCIIGVRI